jgi:hypothetical protein
MAFEKDLEGKSIIKEKWMNDTYGVIALDDGRAIIVEVRMIDTIANVRTSIQNRLAEVNAERDSLIALSSN